MKTLKNMSYQKRDLRDLRISLNLNVGEMAKRLNVKRCTYYKWERREAEPPGCLWLLLNFMVQDTTDNQ